VRLSISSESSEIGRLWEAIDDFRQALSLLIAVSQHQSTSG